MTAAEAKRLLDDPKALEAFLASLELKSGAHEGGLEQGACVMEVVSYVAGEEWTDHPKCASKVITSFAIKLNDRWSDADRQKLKPFIPRIAGTAADDATEKRRAWMCADWAIRTVAPLWLDAAGLAEGAAELRALPEVTPETHDAARDLAGAWRDKARRSRDERWAALEKKNAAAYAAAAAAYAADADAAAAAYAADADADADAYAAAAYAAAAAYGSPGWKKTYDATYKAVTEKLAPTSAKSVELCLEFLGRLIEVRQ